MKNKKLLYVLVPAVLVIWGAIAHRALMYLSVNNDNHTLLMKNQQQGSLVTSNDTFTLLLNYPDPFGYEPRPNSVVNQPRNQIKKNKWPQVQIYGIIGNGNKDCMLVSLSIDNQDAIIKVGERIHQVKLVRVKSQSMTLSFEGEQKQFKLNMGTWKEI